MNVNLRGAFLFGPGGGQAHDRRRSESGQGAHFRDLVLSGDDLVDRVEYSVSKAGLAMATQGFAARLAPEGIGVFEVRPGIIRTDMTAGVSSQI